MQLPSFSSGSPASAGPTSVFIPTHSRPQSYVCFLIVVTHPFRRPRDKKERNIWGLSGNPANGGARILSLAPSPRRASFRDFERETDCKQYNGINYYKSLLTLKQLARSSLSFNHFFNHVLVKIYERRKSFNEAIESFSI